MPELGSWGGLGNSGNARKKTFIFQFTRSVRAEYTVSEEQPLNVVFFDLPKVMSDVSQAVLHNTEDGMYYHTTYLEQSGAQRHKAKESKWSITSIVQHKIHTQTQLASACS